MSTDYAAKLAEQQTHLNELVAKRNSFRKVDCFDRTLEWEQKYAEINRQINETESYITFYASMIRTPVLGN